MVRLGGVSRCLGGPPRGASRGGGPSLNPVAIAQVFLAEGVGGASITSDRGSTPRKGLEHFLQPMGEEQAGSRRSGQWEASVPKANTEPLRGAGLRDTSTHHQDAPSNQKASGEKINPAGLARAGKRVVVRPEDGRHRGLFVSGLRTRSAVLCGGSSWWWCSSSQDRGLVDFRSWVGVPPWLFGVGVTVPRPGSGPPAELSSSAGGPNKDPRGPFLFGNQWPWETLSSWTWLSATWRGLAAGIIVWLILRFLRPPTRPPGFPPGPMVLPLVGNYALARTQNVPKDIHKMCNIFPFIMKLPGPQQEIFRNQKELEAFVKEEIREHKKSRQQAKPRDLIDAYLDKIDEESKNSEEIFNERNLITVVNDLFIAGTETTALTLRWAFLYMMAFPDVQEKCWKEINKVAGTDALPRMDLRSSMPYVEAVLHEVQRVSNIIPFGVGHYTTHDITINNYHVPKKTFVLLNLTSVLNDPEQWKSPGEFRPEHFLDEEGCFQKPEAFLPFSAGPRACLGESLAKTELFLFFTCLLQKFQFVWPDPLSKPDLDPLYKLLFIPKPYKVVVRKRVGA
uniref:Uncharacterized protein n=2 Tax=Eptatretus burgeri TaxID=7764 RepID=A0A8C4QEK6_EPTBU